MSKYSRGNRFKFKGDEYILARVGEGVCALINLRNGNRFSDPVTVSSFTTDLSEAELKQMMSGYADEFVGIDNPYNQLLGVDELEEGKVYNDERGDYAWVMVGKQLYRLHYHNLQYVSFKFKEKA